eukprot:scaffold55361_cov18-Tisochrysis_lutea.AAC.1
MQEVIINTVSSANDYAAQMALLRPNGSLCIVSAAIPGNLTPRLHTCVQRKLVVCIIMSKQGWVIRDLCISRNGCDSL